VYAPPGSATMSAKEIAPVVGSSNRNEDIKLFSQRKIWRVEDSRSREIGG
jgi:hypothetical protein